MGKKLLIPTDFSKNSWNAIQYAIKLYENQDCDFYILNAYSKDTLGLDGVSSLDPDETFNKMSENRSKEWLGDILIRLSKMDKDVNHRFHVLSRSENFLDAVKDVVMKLQIDLIVMGAKGMTNERECKYGRNTLDVIESVRKCPVLIVPKNVTFDHPKEIVLATNFNTEIRASEIKYIAEIAKICNASIQIVSLGNNGSLTLSQKRNKMRLRKYFNGIDHSFNVLYNVKMADALSHLVEIRQHNMISFIDKKQSFWQRIGFGTPSLGKLGYFKGVPVLALHG